LRAVRSAGGRSAAIDDPFWQAGLIEDQAGIVFRRIQNFAESVELAKDHECHGHCLEPHTAIAHLEFGKRLVGHTQALTEICDGHAPLLPGHTYVMAKSFQGGLNLV
jgi:hypothetical protein